MGTTSHPAAAVVGGVRPNCVTRAVTLSGISSGWRVRITYSLKPFTPRRLPQLCGWPFSTSSGNETSSISGCQSATYKPPTGMMLGNCSRSVANRSSISSEAASAWLKAPNVFKSVTRCSRRWPVTASRRVTSEAPARPTEKSRNGPGPNPV